MVNKDLEWIDYYQVLEIDRTADQKTIKKKYYELIHKYHPDIYDGEDAHEKSVLINKAYSILSDEKLKNEYDEAWDKYQNISDVTEDYEEVKKQYTKKEQHFAEKCAFQQVIKEELEKIPLIIENKQDLLMNMYHQELDERTFYDSVKELVKIGIEFIKSLEELITQAETYGLFQEIENIEEAINYLTEELNNIPISYEDVEIEMEASHSKAIILEKKEQAILNADQILEESKEVTKHTYLKNITYLEYPEYYSNIYYRTCSSVNELQILITITARLELEDDAIELTNKMAELEAMIACFPKNSKQATIVGEQQVILENIKLLLEKRNHVQLKMDRIERMLKKHPDSWRAKSIYEYGIQLYEEYISELNEENKRAEKVLNISYTNESKMNELLKQSIKLYENSDEIHKSVDVVFQNKTIKKDNIDKLELDAYAGWNKGKALEMLIQVLELSKTYKGMELYGNEFVVLKDELEKLLKEQLANKEYFLKEYNVEVLKEKEKNSIDDQLHNIQTEIYASITSAVVLMAIAYYLGKSGINTFASEDKNLGDWLWILFALGMGISGVKAPFMCINDIKEKLEEKERLKTLKLKKNQKNKKI